MTVFKNLRTYGTLNATTRGHKMTLGLFGRVVGQDNETSFGVFSQRVRLNVLALLLFFDWLDFVRDTQTVLVGR